MVEITDEIREITVVGKLVAIDPIPTATDSELLFRPSLISVTWFRQNASAYTIVTVLIKGIQTSTPGRGRKIERVFWEPSKFPAWLTSTVADMAPLEVTEGVTA